MLLTINIIISFQKAVQAELQQTTKSCDIWHMGYNNLTLHLALTVCFAGVCYFNMHKSALCKWVIP